MYILPSEDKRLPTCNNQEKRIFQRWKNLEGKPVKSPVNQLKTYLISLKLF